jgi:hypothetical protein
MMMAGMDHVALDLDDVGPKPDGLVKEEAPLFYPEHLEDLQDQAAQAIGKSS